MSNKMVDIELEILQASLAIDSDKLKYKVKTTWCQVDIENGRSSVRLPRLPIIDHYLSNRDDTFIFLEIWSKDENAIKDSRRPKLHGLAKCSIKKQIENPELNPSVKWWEVYNPIEDVIQGKILLRINTKFTISELFENPVSLRDAEKACTQDNFSCGHPISARPVASSYFSTKSPSSEGRADAKGQEVQTDISLISYTRNNNMYKNYNNTTNSSVSSVPCGDTISSKNTIHPANNLSYVDEDFEDKSSNGVDSASINSGRGIHNPASTKTNDTNRASTVTNYSKSSTRAALENQYGLAQKKKTISEIVKSDSKIAPLVTERSDSVENIITLLNQDFDAVVRKSTRYLNNQDFLKTNKNDYNDSKILNGQGRLAPEGRNEGDSDVRTTGTSSFNNSPAKSSSIGSKPMSFLVGRPELFSRSQKTQRDPSKVNTTVNHNVSTRPSRMAAALPLSFIARND